MRSHLVCLALVASVGCRLELGPPRGPAACEGDEPATPRGKVMIYTSMYRQVIDALRPLLASRLPEVEVEWLQAGSEKIATRLDAELAAGAPGADLVLTSDPLWYLRLAEEGRLSPFAAIPALSLPRTLLDPAGRFVTARLSTMVLAYDTRALTREAAPPSFAALLEPRFRGRLTMADPLGSGTAFTTLLLLAHVHGLELIDGLRGQNIVAAGGNTAAINRLETGEHAVAIALLENVLEAQRRGAPIDFVIPAEGAVPIPGPLALLRGGPNPGAAKAVYALLLTPEAQGAIVAAGMHSPLEALPPPPGAPPLSALLESPHRPTPARLAAAAAKRDEVKRRFLGGEP